MADRTAEPEIQYLYTKEGAYQGEQTTPLSARQLTKEWYFGPAPGGHKHAGIDGFERDEIPSTFAAIKSIAHAPHIWGGGYSPVVDSIHGAAMFDYKHKEIITTDWAVDTAYSKGAFVSHGELHWEAREAHTSTNDNAPATDATGWRRLYAFDTAQNIFPMGAMNSAMYIESDALIPSKTGVLFTAKTSKGAAGEIMVGLAVNKPDISQGATGVTQGLLLAIDTSNSDYLSIAVKKATSTEDSFDTDTDWVKSNQATGSENALKISYDHLREGDRHSFRIESNRGVLTLIVDGVKFGTFTYPDDTYPLRKFVEGDKKGELVVHAGFHYSLQTIPLATGFIFDLHDLCFYQLHPESVSHDLSRPAAALVHQISKDAAVKKAIVTLGGTSTGFTLPNKSDDTDVDYFYMGWRDVNDGWLIRRQDFDTSSNADATTGADDFDAAWVDRLNLSYG